MAQVGRISGPLLQENLLRNGRAPGSLENNLTFKDVSSSTALLHLDINNGRIGVNTSTATRELEVDGTTQTTNLIGTTSANTPGYEITGSTFRVLVGDIYLNASEAIVMANMENGTIRISDNIISTVNSNADIDLTPNGTGTTEVINDLNVFGDIYTPGNVTFDGNITFGNADTDTVNFEADLNTNLIPDQNNTYNLGSATKRWETLYTNFVNGQAAQVDGYTLRGIDLLTTNGGVIYVAQEGNDSNSGDHLFDPLATISAALAKAEASGSQPFVILVASGDYQESLPLVVPPNVSIVGQDIRNTVILPDTSSQSQDVFHLNDTNTIANLTIKDFFYDSINNTGYAFRFAPNAVISNRSPYIQNVTVLTQETSAGAGDAGRGAWIDGSELADSVATVTTSDSTSGNSIKTSFPAADVEEYRKYVGWWFFDGGTKLTITDVDTFNSVVTFIFGNSFYNASSGETITIYGPAETPTMLFHSCTFISPGADVINMTNGVRVEWLNSFTYYANRGLYAFPTYSEHSSVAIVERPNGSDETRMILLGELNGKPRYRSTYPGNSDPDVPDIFWTGTNWELNGYAGSEIWTSSSDTVYPWDATNWTETTSTGNDTPVISRGEGFNVGAELRSIGSANVYGTYGAVADGADTLMYLIQHNFAYIGAGSSSTNNLDDVVQANEIVELNSGQIHYVSTDQVGNFRVGDNFFVNLETGETSISIDTGDIESLSGLVINDVSGTTVISGADVTTGNILIDGNDISSTVGDLNLEGATGTININSNTNVYGNLDIRDDFSFGGTLNIAGDQPGRTTSNDRLRFNVDLTQDFKPHVTLTHSLGEAVRPWANAYLDRAEIDDITIDENYITTDISNANLDLRSTNRIYVPSNNVQIDNNLTVNGLLNLQSVGVTGNVTYAGDRTQTGNFNIAGEISNGTIRIEDNFVSTIDSNADLELRANGTGEILVPNNDVQINNNLTVSSSTDLQDISITGTLTHVGNRNQTGNFTLTNYNIAGNIDISSQAQFEEILFDGNVISTTTSNADLELRANGVGRILIPDENVSVVNNLSADYIYNNNNININLQTAFGRADVSNVSIQQNFIDTNLLNTNLTLRANGTGILNIEDSVNLGQSLTVSKDTFLQNADTSYKYGPELVVNGTFDTNLNGWAQAGGGSANDVSGNLQINATGSARNVSQEITVEAGKTYDFEAQFRSVSNGNPFYLRIFESGVGTLAEWNETTGLTNDQIVTTSVTPVSTTIDIIFRAVDTIVEWDNVSLVEDIGFVTTYDPVQVNINDDITQTGNTTKTGNYTQTGKTVVSGNLTVSNEFTKNNINIDANIIQNTGEGLQIAIETNDTSSIPRMVQAIAAGSTADDYVDQTDKNLINFLIDNNYADINNSGTVTTSDYLAYLQYIANGTSGNAEIDASIANILEEIITIEYATPGYFDPVLFDGDYYNPDLELRASGTGNVLFPNNDVNIANELTVLDTFTSTELVSSPTEYIASNNYTLSDTTKIDDNYITTVVSNANLELRASQDNLIYVPSNDVAIDNNLTVNGNTDIDDLAVTGNIVQTGNRTQVGNLNVTGTVTVSTSNIQDNLQLDDILIDANVISSQDSNADLELLAHGTGIIEIPGNNVQINNNITVGTLDATNIAIDASFSFEEFELSSDIQLFDNVITTTESNSNLELRTSDNSSIVLQDLFVNSDTISTLASDIDLTVNDNITISANGAIKIPSGTTAERQLVDSAIRFNSTDNVFEAFRNGSTITFNGVYSSNRRTSILAHPTNNTLNFTVANIQVGQINADGLQINGLDVDDVFINDNTIVTNISNSDLSLQTNGTGSLVLDDVSIINSTIRNSSNNALTIQNTLYGKTKFFAPAVKIPSGTTAEQPVAPEVGTTRWNTDEEILEVWDGSTFITAAGSQATISAEEMDDLILEYTLIFG